MSLLGAKRPRNEAFALFVVSLAIVGCSIVYSQAQREHTPAITSSTTPTEPTTNTPTVADSVAHGPSTPTSSVVEPHFDPSINSPLWIAGVLADQSGVFVGSELAGRGDEWCSAATALWEWRHDAQPELAIVVPGTRVRFSHVLDDGRTALIVQCAQQGHALHLIDGEEIIQTVKIPLTFERLLAKDSTVSDGAVTFGGVEVDLATFEVTGAPQGARPWWESSPSPDGFQIVLDEVDGLGCELSGIEYAFNLTGPVGQSSELVRDASYGVFDVLWGPDGQFVLSSGTCSEGWNSLAVGVVDAQTGTVESFEPLCYIPQLHDRELHSYRFDAATFTGDELRMWRGGWEYLGYVSLDLGSLPLQSSTPEEACQQ